MSNIDSLTEEELIGLLEENERLRFDLADCRIVLKAQERESAGLEARCAAMRAALEAAEWGTEGMCPDCRAIEGREHCADCSILAALQGGAGERG